jgi:hypothetical protein
MPNGLPRKVAMKKAALPLGKDGFLFMRRLVWLPASMGGEERGGQVL